MEVFIDDLDLVLKGFWVTLQLWAASGAIALVVGTVVAVMRVNPVKLLRGVGAAYVTLFRNTPLLILIVLTYFGLPRLGIDFGFFWNTSMAMGIYTAAFVCEALRSGINGIGMGQAEAARAIGMPFGMTMTQVVLPQAYRLVVPPLASVLIALVKNTSLAAAFGLAEAAFRMQGMLRDHASSRVEIFMGFALGYIIIVSAVSFVANRFEKHWSVER